MAEFFAEVVLKPLLEVIAFGTGGAAVVVFSLGYAWPGDFSGENYSWKSLIRKSGGVFYLEVHLVMAIGLAIILGVAAAIWSMLT